MNKKRGLIFVLIVLVLAFTALSETEGCYLNQNSDDLLYCNQILLEQAEADCAQDPTCDNANDFFIPFSDCSDQDQCQQVQCDLSCDFMAKGKCEALGGQEVTPELQNVLCTPGCCIFQKTATENSCQANYVQKECELAGEQQGFPTTFLPGKDQTACSAVCDVEIEKSTLTGTITDTENKPIINAIVKITGQSDKITADDGVYFSDQLTPGIYVIKVTAQGHLPQTAEITLSEGETATKNFQLLAIEGGFTLSGSITDQNSQPLSNVKITYTSELASGETTSTETGQYSIEQLPEGTYQITASKIGFSPSTKSITLTANADLSFQLSLPVTAGVEGTTQIDFTGDLIGQPFATDIYIDGIFRGKSKFPDGKYEISLELFAPDSEHSIQAFYQSYQSEKLTFKIQANQYTQVPNMILFTHIGECSKGQPDERKNVESFTLSPIKGESKIQLQWTKPCAEVSGYIISKTNLKTTEIDSQWQTFPPSINTYIDIDVDWETTYEYGIKAVYTDDELRESEAANIQQLITGNSACEDRYHDSTQWETFCQIANRQQVLTCDNDNNVFVSSDCSQLQEVGKQFFCAQVSATTALCKDAAICSISATPFGLYATRNSCYGTDTPESLDQTNYCVYDQSTTPVNQCVSCTTITSCFEYQSKDACKVNNCVSNDCSWVEALSSDKILNYDILSPLAENSPFFVTQETGAGYCVQDNYQNDDKCNLCGPHANLFENNFCTADVCSNLGRCFSGDQLLFCEECGPVPTSDATCYQYETQTECEGPNPVSIDSFGKITPSSDSCNWGSCTWNNGACIKDNDGDQQDDCSTVQGTANCRIDNAAPQTTIFPQGLPVISLTNPEITFEGDDSFHLHTSQKNPLGELWYCITSSTEADTCTLDKFVSKKYPGASPKETVTINLLEFPELGTTPPQGTAYKLKFFSKDIYNNQEQVQQTFVYIDNVAPKFVITIDPQTVGDTSTLEVTLNNMVEPMACVFELTSKLPTGEQQTESLTRDVEFKQITFTELKAIHYSLTVTCTDDRTNVNTEQIDIVFDLEQAIDVINPPTNGFVGSNKIVFQVNTLVGSTCELFETTTNTKAANFQTDAEGKSHQTELITITKAGGNAGSYAGLYKIICSGFVDNKIYDELLNFNVDLTAPEAFITLSENSHIASPTTFNWEEFFIEKVDVSLSCDLSGFEGIPCEQIFYCLGAGCDIFDNPSFQEFTEPFTLEESNRICYFATDASNHKPNVICGDIKVEGYGITLLKPQPYIFNGETYGISGTPQFDFEFTTAIPSSECRFDFSPGFDYEQVPAFKILNNEGGTYKFPNFPGPTISNYSENGGTKSLFIKCKNSEEELSPEKKIILEYDPTQPGITDLSANPDPVVEGISTILNIATDSKAKCKFSDNSNGTGSTEYDSMPYSFAGADNELFIEHQVQFDININQPKKDFILSVQCKNGAGNFTATKNLTFSVDYVSKGVITNVFPDGEFFNTDEITLQVQTTKSSQCTFEFNNATLPLTADGNTHSAVISSFTEKKYIVPVHCIMQDHTAEDTISFTIDKTGPSLLNVTDGDYTCGSKTISINLGTAEQMQSASYELYQKGFFVGNNIIAQGQTDGTNPFSIDVSNLTINKEYFVKVVATDSAGNVGTQASSNGFTVTNANFTICKQDKSAPDIFVKLNKDQCSAIYASLDYTDETGVNNIKYGTASSSTQCTPTLNYFGSIEFTKKGYLCYTATDNTGNTKTQTYLVNYDDDDGDGILDSCDYCSGTSPGKVVDENGCGTGELTPYEQTVDSDGDGLPDIWELQHNFDGCNFDPNLEDSDNDGLSDATNDYDNDGRSNFIEFTQSTDPCSADEAPITSKEPTDPTTPTKKPTTKKDSNLLAWIIFLLGLLMFLGGAGYLIYYYKSKGKKPMYTSIIKSTSTPTSSKPTPTWKKELFQQRQQHADKTKQRSRRGIFGAFGIPHIGKMVHKKQPTPANLHKLSKAYVQHKKDIGIKSGEKGVFAKLESIASKPKPTVNKKEAKDIFSKLKKISQKRKNG